MQMRLAHDETCHGEFLVGEAASIREISFLQVGRKPRKYLGANGMR